MTSQFPTSERWDVADRLWTKTPPSGLRLSDAFIGSVVKLWMSKRSIWTPRVVALSTFFKHVYHFLGLNPLLWKDSVSGYVDSRNSGNQFLAWAFFEAIECGETTYISGIPRDNPQDPKLRI